MLNTPIPNGLFNQPKLAMEAGQAGESPARRQKQGWEEAWAEYNKHQQETSKANGAAQKNYEYWGKEVVEEYAKKQGKPWKREESGWWEDPWKRESDWEEGWWEDHWKRDAAEGWWEDPCLGKGW